MGITPLIDTSGSLYNYLQRVNSIFLGPLPAVILLGFLTRRVSAVAAKAGLLIGPVIFYLLVFTFGDEVQAGLMGTFGLIEDVHFLHLLGLVFVLTAVMMTAISRLKPAPEVYEARETGDVDMAPWPRRHEVAVAICVITVGFYVFLAQ